MKGRLIQARVKTLSSREIKVGTVYVCVKARQIIWVGCFIWIQEQAEKQFGLEPSNGGMVSCIKDNNLYSNLDFGNDGYFFKPVPSGKIIAAGRSYDLGQGINFTKIC